MAPLNIYIMAKYSVLAKKRVIHEKYIKPNEKKGAEEEGIRGNGVLRERESKESKSKYIDRENNIDI